jgi:hypothetical protein
MRALVALGADVHAVTTSGDTALHLARTTETVAWLLEVGAGLNRLNNWGETPLVHVIRKGHVPAVKALVQAGACPDIEARLSLVDEAVCGCSDRSRGGGDGAGGGRGGADPQAERERPLRAHSCAGG